jgi:hypothetical protein
VNRRSLKHQEFYEYGEIVRLLMELQELGVDIDEIPLSSTINDLVSMLNRLRDE